ncbi:hypothetical protein ABB37_09264 [Leptomonas pyrrhocoris]|uniref:Uncharacterized protein n=1 Tax=Leptomonas pyrrhocoris TaxID=157538 RepID=A0A0M9FR97_LEPPY|nr:hypothetical protein ABB37_09264 [Leptomonas pyrrhocoris]KPA74256.1 hypothetical protein ABB37_09264 [Leptomonas pyrrhocoris]|eukprot:XP_015652695.1 hypothetical protein ABB37_09264 [Leptomonas pyrrhocoris]
MPASSFSASTSPPPPSAFGCQQQQAYSFPLHCKRSFNPTLTHQFRVEWPWPVLRSAATAATPAMNKPDLRLVTHKEDTAGEDDDFNEGGAVDDTQTTAVTPGSTTPLWRDRRRYGRPTFIVDLSGDPFIGELDTRRAGLLLSLGHRLLLPLIALEPPEELPDKAGPAHWKTEYKAPRGETAANATPPPHCAELLVGEVAAIEKMVRQRRESVALSATRRSAGAFAMPSFFSRINLSATQSADTAPSAVSQEVVRAGEAEGRSSTPSPPPPPVQQTARTALCAPPQRKPVQSYFFYSLPFRVRWLSQLQGRLVVTLPCEERILTLHAPHRLAPSAAAVTAAAAAAPVPITLVHSFSFSRGVVPLEVAEVFDRPFLAIGTHEHGVLLCSLNTASGAVEAIARVISLKGYGGAFFPVTRLAVLFPPQQRSRTAHRPASSVAAASPLPSPPWVPRAAALETLRDGVLLCSSPYEPAAILVKLDGSPEGVVEDFAMLRGVDTVLDVAPAVQPDLGPLLCTTGRKVQWLRFLQADEEAEALAAVRARRSDGAVAERCAPAVLCERMARFDYPLLRLLAGPPVLQTFAGKYVSRHRYAKHWHFGVDNRNQVILMDRTVRQYLFQSAFQLYRRLPEEQRATPPGSMLTSSTTTAGEGGVFIESDGGSVTLKVEEDEEKTEETAVAVKQEEADAGNTFGHVPATRGAKRTRPSATAISTAATRNTAPSSGRRCAKQPKAEAAAEDGTKAASGNGVVGTAHAFACSVPLEDACSGVVVVFAKDEAIQVAAAHDRCYVSLVTWRVGPPQPPPPPASFFAPTVKEEK